MKKYLFFMVLPCLFSFLLCGCNSTPKDNVLNSISEIHNNYFIGSTQNFKIAMWSGQREEPFEENGISGDLVDFCVISIIPQTKINTFGVSYTAEINDKTFNGEFEQSPFDKSLATDLKVKLNDEDVVFVYVIVDGITEIGKMECISKNFKINNISAIDNSILKSDNLLQDFYKNSKNNIECYCKIISSDKNLGIYFWYVRFINDQGKEIIFVIDTQSGEIVAKKV